MSNRDLRERIDELYETPVGDLPDDTRSVFDKFLDVLEAGELRSARPDEDGGWQVVPTVKRGILLGFRIGTNREFPGIEPFQFADRDTYPTQNLPMAERNIRVVPGGSAVRRGAYVGSDVTVMPPAYINVGAYVDDETMVDSHALVGSCAQIGERVHLSAGAQIGGVLEPVGQTPVVVEDDALIGGNTGIFEGVRVREGAVVAAGSVITGSSPIYDLVEETVYTADDDGPLTIPPRAVVVPGSRPASGEFADAHNLQLDALVIVKYRDEQTDAQTALEQALR
jgi:2,3,4,5-tetrahydropyridine-2-carboxylate N-succinyltransferase